MNVALLAIVARPHLDDAEGTEFLRLLAAVVALDRPLAVLETGRGVGALTGPERALTADGEHYLAALVEEGVAIRTAHAADLADALAAASALVVLPDPDRRATPPVLSLARGRRPSDQDVKDLLSAAQVRLEPGDTA